MNSKTKVSVNERSWFSFLFPLLSCEYTQGRGSWQPAKNAKAANLVLAVEHQTVRARGQCEPVERRAQHKQARKPKISRRQSKIKKDRVVYKEKMKQIK